jgi:hypothetical protein
MATSLLSADVTGELYHEHQGVGYLQNNPSMQRAAYRRKAAISENAALPRLASDLISIPAKYRSLSIGELFLQFE